MTTSCTSESSTVSLYLAMELSNGTWELAFSAGRGRKPRLGNVSARDLNGLLREIAHAKGRFGLHDDAPVVCCYEAVRDGLLTAGNPIPFPKEEVIGDSTWPDDSQ